MLQHEGLSAGNSRTEKPGSHAQSLVLPAEGKDMVTKGQGDQGGGWGQQEEGHQPARQGG